MTANREQQRERLYDAEWPELIARAGEVWNQHLRIKELEGEVAQLRGQGRESDAIREIIRTRREAIAERDRARDIAVALEQENARLTTAIEDVRKLHAPYDDAFTKSRRCGRDDVSWPCPTIRALDGA